MGYAMHTWWVEMNDVCSSLVDGNSVDINVYIGAAVPAFRQDQ